MFEVESYLTIRLFVYILALPTDDGNAVTILRDELVRSRGKTPLCAD
jgi:hypothetical protein